MYYFPSKKGTNWAAIIAGLAAVGIGGYVVYWAWQNGYLGGNKKVSCASNSDCPQGQICGTDGTCQLDTNCSSNANCPTGEHCTDGFCVPDAPTTTIIGGQAMGYYENVRLGPVAGMTITFTNKDTNQTYTGVSDLNGYWYIANIPFGVYSTHASAAGYYDTNFPYIPITSDYQYPGGCPLQKNSACQIAGVDNMIWMPTVNFTYSGAEISGCNIAFDKQYTMNHLEGTIGVNSCWGYVTRSCAINVVDVYGASTLIYQSGWNENQSQLNVNVNFTEKKLVSWNMYAWCRTVLPPEYSPIKSWNLTFSEKVL